MNWVGSQWLTIFGITTPIIIAKIINIPQEIKQFIFLLLRMFIFEQVIHIPLGAPFGLAKFGW